MDGYLCNFVGVSVTLYCSCVINTQSRILWWFSNLLNIDNAAWRINEPKTKYLLLLELYETKILLPIISIIIGIL